MTDFMAVVTLTLPASAAHVRTARLIAAAMARRSGVEEDLLDEVRLAVGEACARAVRLHQRFGVTDPVTVEFSDGARFGIAVRDRAPGAGETGWAGAERAAGAGADAAGRPPAADLPGGAPLAADPPAAGPPGMDGPGPDRPALIAEPWADPTGEALGLTLLAALDADLSVAPAGQGVGTRVAMSWPIGG